MKKPTIKKEFKGRVIAYNGQSLPLGERDDLEILAEIAKKSGDKTLLEVFEEVPTNKEIAAVKAEKTVAEIKEATETKEK